MEQPGMNAHQAISEKEALILSRDEAYIGVLIDDLINKGTDEPYRMFTSRAEYRILLRQDNADARLCETGHNIGLLDNEKHEKYLQKSQNVKSLIEFSKQSKPDVTYINSVLSSLESSMLDEKTSLNKLLLRPHLTFKNLTNGHAEYSNAIESYTTEEIEEAEILIKYAGYIDKEREMAKKISSLEHIHIKESFDYSLIKSLSTESREKLSKIKPATIGQASRISGVSPADISILLVHFGR
jgi:tRNA uridine 5-carboxymethylaminomethyl modification enzyme